MWVQIQDSSFKLRKLQWKQQSGCTHLWCYHDDYGWLHFYKNCNLGLSFGNTSQVSFDPWTPAATGPYTIVVYSSLSGDTDNNNDTLTKDVLVYEASKIMDGKINRSQHACIRDGKRVWTERSVFKFSRNIVYHRRNRRSRSSQGMRMPMLMLPTTGIWLIPCQPRNINSQRTHSTWKNLLYGRIFKWIRSWWKQLCVRYRAWNMEHHVSDANCCREIMLPVYITILSSITLADLTAARIRTLFRSMIRIMIPGRMELRQLVHRLPGYAEEWTGIKLFMLAVTQVNGGPVDEAYQGTVDPANPANITWTALPPYPGGRVSRLAAGTVFKNLKPLVIFAGGDPTGQGSEVLGDVWGWDLTLNQWLVGAEKILMLVMSVIWLV